MPDIQLETRVLRGRIWYRAVGQTKFTQSRSDAIYYGNLAAKTQHFLQHGHEQEPS